MVKNKNNQAIWNTRIKKNASRLFQKIGNSIDIDKRLYKEDIQGSIAHVEMLFKQKIISNFNKLFEDNPIVNKLSFDDEISIMKWRASQPSGISVPLSLQFSKKSRIGFCGDWFEGEGFGRIEGSILSALTLAKIFKV